ncbi:peptidoglycan DD-metalloendopeptidase family protein [Vibrio sp. 99-70-13A1]|uniref:peptidoglycan DD-metalloendopeptidase family protein n=1 Tax=Vibrio sp. 99-70-13A1 TaxID=2607601 RepID=UPI001493B0E7|nr:peptidoglycan DD-metalloendopeptidase family protein [Vibrio sp. 99-70-13A1]NOH98568.1 peptidoglycan DD-metalloendopeptidase family protein [Vibrio sp. 99-70-13A1]
MGLGFLKGLMIGLSCILVGCAAQSPAPVSGLNKDYSSISRGSYRGSYYEVEKGDTLYFIAYVTNKNVNDLISFNNLKSPYVIHPGQKLKLWRPAYVAPSHGKAAPVVVAPVVVPSASTPSVTVKTSAKSTEKPVTKPSSPSKQAVKEPVKPPVSVVKKDSPKKVEQSKPKEYVGSKGKQNVTTTNKPKNEKVSKWLWPTKGRVIKNFSVGEQGNKGIDIAGQRGQAIISTAGGTVVYSGNALRGYGNLVIVKHNDNYLSAYAHNDKLLVSEGQNVKSGQKIATMGSSGSSSVRLHFEIRYQGKSVNPKRYLP